MKSKNIKTTNKLSSWLFTRPAVFVPMALVFIFVFFLIGGGLTAALDLSYKSGAITMITTTLLSFIYPIYYLIKKLPHDDISRSDFIAIANGAAIISLIASLVAIIPVVLYGKDIQNSLMILYLFNRTMFIIMFAIMILLTMYLIGVAVSAVYAKYKRCRTIGIDAWKIILSMPFSFLMLWTPGYLIEDKNKKSKLQIKSGWYSQFNKWVVSNFANTLTVFLLLLFFKDVVSGTPTLALSLVLLGIYTLWYVKHKTDFIKNINRGYALTAVGINIAIIIVMLVGILV